MTQCMKFMRYINKCIKIVCSCFCSVFLLMRAVKKKGFCYAFKFMFSSQNCKQNNLQNYCVWLFHNIIGCNLLRLFI